MNENQLIQNLSRYYQTQRPDLIHPEVHLNWVNHTGWESEIYGFTLTFGPTNQRLSVRRVLRLMTVGQTDSASKEYRALSLLHQAGYPVPEVYAVGKAANELGHPFLIMQCIEGGSFASRFTWDAQKNPQPLEHFIALFRRLHKLNWRPYAADPEKLSPSGQPYFHFDRTLALHASYLTSPPLSEFSPVMDWLRQHRSQVPCERGAAVHQDFHPDNILEDAKGKLYVIDWTNFEISDYRFDLAWTLTLAYAYRGAASREQILEEYERQLEEPVQNLQIFEVDAILRRIGSIMLSLSQGADSLGMRAETVEIMKQQKEPIARLYRRLQSLTNMRVPAVESLLENLRS